MAEMGMAMMGAARASGENRAVEAAQRAISSPLLEDVSIKGARGLLINVTGGPDMSLYEVNEAASLIQEEAHEDANIIFGAVIDEKISDEIHVTVIATGFGEREHEWHSPRYSPSGTPITAPVQAAPTRPIELQPQPAPTVPSPLPAPPLQSGMMHGKPVRRLGLIVDESSLDIPTFKRRSNEQGGPTRLGQEGLENDDKLDVPAFLRKQPD
jgi:cell division protein FtsZ